MDFLLNILLEDKLPIELYNYPLTAWSADPNAAYMPSDPYKVGISLAVTRISEKWWIDRWFFKYIELPAFLAELPANVRLR